jgi:hypothetical protein
MRKPDARFRQCLDSFLFFMGHHGPFSRTYLVAIGCIQGSHMSDTQLLRAHYIWSYEAYEPSLCCNGTKEAYETLGIFGVWELPLLATKSDFEEQIRIYNVTLCPNSTKSAISVCIKISHHRLIKLYQALPNSYQEFLFDT